MYRLQAERQNQYTILFIEPGPRTCTSRCYNRSSGRRDNPPLGEGNIDQCQAADSCTPLATDNNPQKRQEICPWKVGSPTARHDASNLEPTVQGSWPRELRFYRNRKGNRQNIVASPWLVQKTRLDTYPVISSLTLGHLLGPCSRDGEENKQDDLCEGHGGQRDKGNESMNSSVERDEDGPIRSS